MTTPYTKEYYQSLREGVRKSAEAIVPLVMELLHPRSVIDVGCGTGIWLSVFKKHGASDILGIDREYVTGEILEIPGEEFLCHDLRNPLELNRRFDLVVSLEVAEHLPAECAESFVQTLTRLGPAILFSAAIPFQGGTDHLNEQWPDYWARHFEQNGYVPIDLIRKRVWQNADVEFWYCQNILLFVGRDGPEIRPDPGYAQKDTRNSQLSLVHPRLLSELGAKYMEAVRKQEIFSEESQKNREEADRHRRTAEQYIAEAEKLKSEMVEHRAKAERYIAEAEKLKSEIVEHRAKAEHYITEADRYREETAVHRKEAEFHTAEAEKYKSELEAHRAKVEFYRKESEEFRAKAEPRNMSLRQVVKALPVIIASAFRREAEKWSKRRDGKGE